MYGPVAETHLRTRLFKLFETKIRRTLAKSTFARFLRRTLAKSHAFLIFFLILIAKIRDGESFGKLSPFILSSITVFVVVSRATENIDSFVGNLTRLQLRKY